MSMHPAVRRALLVPVLLSFSFTVAAEDRADARTPGPAAALSLAEAVRLSLTDQPLVSAREAMIEAQEQQAVAAAQLPDPQLTGGLKELPVDGGEAFSTRRDDFTEFTVGLRQDFPRAGKRQLQGERRHLEADVERSGLANDRRAVRRNTSLAWLDVYESEHAMELTRQMAAEAGLQVQSLDKDYRSGKASQADWLAAKVEAGLADDKAHDWLHHALRMRAGLARWIGDDASRPLDDELAPMPPAGGLPDLIAAVDHHPAVGELDRQIDVSTTGIALARQSYRPDFSVEGYFAYRQDYAEFVGVQVSIDLPYFTKNRQDRDLAAALRQSTASLQRKRDLLRELHAQVDQDYLDWQHFQIRLGEFDRVIVPDARRRIDAARGAYEAGRGSFDAVLLARRGLLDIQLQRLALAMEAARASIRLDYLAGPATLSGEGS